MKRLCFILGIVAATACGLARRRKPIALAMPDPKRKTWAEHVTESGRRYEHFIHMKYCHGDYDHLSTPEDAAKRKARCAEICRLCRYLNSPTVWPGPNYRRPSDSVLKALERETYYEQPHGLGAAAMKEGIATTHYER